MDTVAAQSRWQEQSFGTATGSAQKEWLHTIPSAPPRRMPMSAGASAAESRTPLGARLREIRAKAVAAGERLLTWDEIEQEVAERRGRPLDDE